MCRKYLLKNLFFYSSSLLRGVIFILMLCMLGLRTQALYAQKLDSTASMVPPTPHVNDSVTTKKDYKIDITYQGLGFVAAGLLIKSRQHDFREMRNLFQKDYHQPWDNFTQYAPLVATWGLHAAGVEGQSSWKRLAASNAISAVFMAGLTNTLKYTVRERRPDGSSSNSFPSGHTATAFMAATILHKEYGQTQSPWYSVAGYSMATATAVGRVLNNRHWVTDVLVGAGVGIIATDLGYFVTDLLMKGKGKKRSVLKAFSSNEQQNPSFLGITVDAGMGTEQLSVSHVAVQSSTSKNYQVDDHAFDLHLHLGTNVSVSMEGAYFLNNYVGLGGQIRATAIPIKATFDVNPDNYLSIEGVDKQLIASYMKLIGTEAYPMGMFDFSEGVYFSYPIFNRLRVGSKLLVGRRLVTDQHVYAVAQVDVDDLRAQINSIPDNNKLAFATPEIKARLLKTLDSWGDGQQARVSELMSQESTRAMVYSTEASLTWAYRPGLSFKGYIGYDYSSPKYTFHTKHSLQQQGEPVELSHTHTFIDKIAMHQFHAGFGMFLSF